MRYGVNVQAALRPRVRESAATTLEKDLFVNLLVMLLLLVGGHSLLTGARASSPDLPARPAQGVVVYVEEHGALHLGSLCSPVVTVEAIEASVRAAAGQGNRPVPILIHHTASTQAGFLHPVLQVVGRVLDTQPLLALSQYAHVPCKGEETRP